jgi:hypothetical protein
MSLTNEQIEEQLLQLADALAQVSEMTATAFEKRDMDLEALKEKVAALEAKAGRE